MLHKALFLKVMLESAVSKGAEISAVFPLAFMVSHHGFCFGGCFVLFRFINNLSLSQHGKDSSHPGSQHWKALVCPVSSLPVPPSPTLSPLLPDSLKFGIAKKNG